jgi:selenocysteine-specific elongation factor
MQVIATAGHVDHGKSTLVRALTGMEPDRWAEERRRGLTIDLGFAWTGDLAFVDVPGHERFVPNMLAGVGPVPAAMLVVAADEGWMPQSAEHLAALDAFGVRDGLLVITKSDLADPEPVRRQVLEYLSETGLAGVPAVAVSARTGAGLADLREALADLAARLPSADPEADVRLWIDRAFSVKGAGTVVTGTLGAGSLSTGDELVTSSGQSVRIRGLQSLGEDRDRAEAVSRVAVNLRGIDRSGVGRGTALLTPGAWRSVDAIDVAVSHEPPDRSSRNLVFHVGSAAVAARLRPLGDGFARLVLARSLPLRVGDRGLLRDPSRHRIAGAVVLAVDPPPLDRRGAGRVRSAELAAFSRTPMRLRRPGLVHESVLRAEGLVPDGVPIHGGWYADDEYWNSLVVRAGTEVDAWAAAHPVSPGMPSSALQQRLDLPDAELLAPVLASTGLEIVGGLVYRPGSAEALPVEVDAAVRAVEADLAASPFRAPSAERLAELGLGRKELAAAVRTGRLIQLADGVVLLPSVVDRVRDILASLPSPFTAGEVRTALGTSRRVTIPLLEYLDRHGITRRHPDDTRDLT